MVDAQYRASQPLYGRCHWISLNHIEQALQQKDTRSSDFAHEGKQIEGQNGKEESQRRA
jgi:hypothetical protein